MRKLLIINDNSPEAKHAAEFALSIAQRVEVDLMLVNTFQKTRKAVEKVAAGIIVKGGADIYSYQESKACPFSEIHNHLKALNNKLQEGFKPEIEEFDLSGMNENEVIDLVNRNHIWMMVKGMADEEPAAHTKMPVNIHSVLNRVLCPLLLIPVRWALKDIERLVYIADLRYCRIQVVRYLADIAGPWDASLSIAHMSARGLPDMDENYALTVFSEEVSNNVNYDQLFFNNIKEKDLSKVIDVLISGMHNDVLVMVNHQFHFEEIIGRYITETLPQLISVPLLIFPY
ncbi:MAG: universal stress protein [Sphingobacteriales bacterium]